LDTLISNVTVVTMNEKMEVLFGACIGITQGKISYLGQKAPDEMPAEIVDGTGMVAMPGLVNCHTHLTDTVLRGLLDEMDAPQALEQLLQKRAKLDLRSAKAAAQMGIAECLRFGITSVSDLSDFPEAVAEAAAEAGIKANVALSASRFEDDNEEFDFETDAVCGKMRALTEKFHGYDDGRILVDAGIYAEYTSNHQLWEAVSDYAREKGLGMQLHLAQTEQEVEDCLDRTGLGAGELLSCHRVFDNRTAATDCAFLSDEERALLGKRHVTAVATPIAAAKAGRGTTPIAACVKAGMNVALGTGGAVDSGNLDLFEAMRLAVLQARQSGNGAQAMPASAGLMMATTCGARAQGRTDSCGMLKEGLDADIVLVDFSAPHLMPCHNVLSTLVFGAKGGDVAMTMVRGKILYRSGSFPTLELGTVVQELTQYAIPRLFEQTQQ